MTHSVVPGASPDVPASNPPAHHRCRSLTVRGIQCRGSALRGGDLCIQHARYRFPVCPTGPRVAIPLLEDLDTVRVVLSQATQGLFANTLDPQRAGKILYACHIAASTFPRPARLQPTGPPPAQQPASDIFPAPDGSLLGPSLPWSPDLAAFNPVWSYHKHLYEQECARLGKPLPQGPDDFPADGWLNKEDSAEYARRPEDVTASFWERIFRLRVEADQRGLLPPLQERSCAYFTYRDCNGPASDRPCEFCFREREENLRLPPREQPDPHRESSSVSEPTPGPAAGPLPDLRACCDPAPRFPHRRSQTSLNRTSLNRTSLNRTSPAATSQDEPSLDELFVPPSGTASRCRNRQQKSALHFQRLATVPTQGGDRTQSTTPALPGHRGGKATADSSLTTPKLKSVWGPVRSE